MSVVTFRFSKVEAKVELAPIEVNTAEWFAARIAQEIESLLTCNKPIAPLIAISGGSTPIPIYKALAQDRQNLVQNVCWCQTDERDVPPKHPESNQGMIRKNLFGVNEEDSVPNFLAVPLPRATAPETTAQKYEELLLKQINKTVAKTIDAVWLGVGEDGHTASLFPNTDWLNAAECKLFKAIAVPRLNAYRYTLTFDALVKAGLRIFVATGKAKADIIYRLFNEGGESLPAGRLLRSAPTLWLLDSTAGTKVLKKHIHPR